MPRAINRFALLACLSSLLLACNALASTPTPLTTPKIIVSGLDAEFEISDPGLADKTYRITFARDGRELLAREGLVPDVLDDVVLPENGIYHVTLESGGEVWTTTVRAIPGIISILPPVLAIVMALVFRQVVVALFAGIWLGAFFVTGHQVVRSFFYVVDHYVVDSLAGDSDHVAIAIFTMLLGGMVGVFSRIGGTRGVANEIAKIATTPRRGQLATWLMGLAIFFDDYTNTLIVGNTMRPITDRLRISREKLSYIVDSTAAPVAVIAVITSWVGFEISLIKDAFETVGIDRNPLTTFVASIQYSFYPIFTLVFGLFIAASTRDYGPMRKAEVRARTTGMLLSEKAVPLSNIDKDVVLDETDSPRWYNAAIPILVVVFGTLAGLVITGRSSLLNDGVESFTLMDTIRESNSFTALVWSSLAGCTAAILLGLAQRLASLLEIMNAWVAGVKSMITAFIVLVLAWCVGAVCSDLQAADYLVSTFSGVVRPVLLPTLIFLIAAAVSFATGTSWTTMTILTPICIPLVVQISELNALNPGMQDAILLSSIAAIMAGSVFGDHSSPISDTTIMSSMASASDHIDHVRTQLPYALTVAAIAVVLGFLPAGFNTPSIVSLVLGGAAVFAVIRFVGKTEMAGGGQA